MASEYVRVQPSPKLARQVQLRDQLTCQYCATAEARQYVLEHVIPVAKGGPTADYNLVVACLECNRAKYTHVWLPLNIETLEQLNPEWGARIRASAVKPPPLTVEWELSPRAATWGRWLQETAIEHHCEPWHLAQLAVWEFALKYEDKDDELEELVRTQLRECGMEPEPAPEPDYEAALQAYAA